MERRAGWTFAVVLTLSACGDDSAKKPTTGPEALGSSSPTGDTATNTTPPPPTVPTAANCTWPQGVFKTNPELWDSQSDFPSGCAFTANETFDGSSDMTALDVLLHGDTEGDATLILARQYIAAVLNDCLFDANADVEPDIAAAGALLASFPVLSNPQDPDRQTLIAAAAKLGAFNESSVEGETCP